MKRKKLVSNASFTLLEIIISATLISVGVVAVVKCISTGVYADYSVEGKLVGLNYAIQKMETLLNYSYSDSNLASSSPACSASFTTWNSPATNYYWCWTITDNTNYKTVLVTVSWYYKSRAMSLNLASYMANVSSS